MNVEIGERSRPSSIRLKGAYVMLRKPLGLLGIFLIVVGFGISWAPASPTARSRADTGVAVVQRGAERRAELQRGRPTGRPRRGRRRPGDQSLLEDDWGFPIVESDLDPNDPLVNSATEYMYQMATISYHTLHGTQTVT